MADGLPLRPRRAVAARSARTLVVRAGLLAAVGILLAGLWATFGLGTDTGGQAAAQAAPLPTADVSASLAPTAAGPTTLEVPGAQTVTPATMDPGTVLIPSAGIYIHWQPAAVTAGKAVVPTDGTAGMWDGGATSTSPAGTVLMWAHVDDGRAGPGPFATLTQTVPNGAVYVRDHTGTLTTWQVTRIYTEPRISTHPDLFTTDGPRRLALVTCGGTIADGHYTRNVIVIATPQETR